MTLEVTAPCNSTYLQGIKEEGHIVLYVDEVVVLVVAFELDDRKQSWEESCGSI